MAEKKKKCSLFLNSQDPRFEFIVVVGDRSMQELDVVFRKHEKRRIKRGSVRGFWLAFSGDDSAMFLPTAWFSLRMNMP